MTLCAVEGCGRPTKSGAWCHGHYERQRRGDDLGGPFLDTLEKRFFAKVEKTNTCWLWLGATDGGKRYGSFQYEGKVRRAHRVSWVLAGRPDPGPGLDLDHLCRVTLCVNPSHLEPVTHRENIMRGQSIQAANAHKTHCLRGHEFTEENTIRMKSGGRSCRECARTRYERRPRNQEQVAA